jgi:hypothetical protein
MFADIKSFKQKYPNSTVDFNGNLKKGKIVINFNR